MMRFDVLTLFPEMFDCIIHESILGKALEDGLIQINLTNIRDFSGNKHKKVDDYPYGGGAGMVLQPQCVYDSYSSIVENLDYKPEVIYLSPQGKVFNQQMAQDLCKQNHIILLCGHYEGIDQRVLDEIVTREISVGDYVLTGGELPAMIMIDSISRLVPGVLSPGSCEDESFNNGLLEYPQYTRPPLFMGREVPEVLLSGHHANIQQWRHEQSLKRTYYKRPDLLKNLHLSNCDAEYIKSLNNI